MARDLSQVRIKKYIAKASGDACVRGLVNLKVGKLFRAIGVTWNALWTDFRKLEKRSYVGRVLSSDKRKNSWLRIGATNNL